MTALAITAGIAAYIGFVLFVARFVSGGVPHPRRRIVDHHPHQDMPRDLHPILHRQVGNSGMVGGSAHAEPNHTRETRNHG